MVDDVLVAGLAAGLAILALAVLYLGVLSVKLNRQEDDSSRPDPHVTRLAELTGETLERRQEMQRNLESLRATVKQGLRGHKE